MQEPNEFVFQYDFGTFEMSLTIYEFEYIYWKIIGEKHLKFT